MIMPTPAAGTFCEIGRHAFKTILSFLQAGMHGAHESPVLNLGKAQVQGSEQQGVSAVNFHALPLGE
jgi:hypothetical protein